MSIVLDKKNWKTLPLSEVADFFDNRRKPVKESDRVVGPYPYYGANGLQGWINDFIFDEDLILLAEDGGNFGSKSRPIAYTIEGKTWVNNHAHVLKQKSFIDIRFLLRVLEFYDVTPYIKGATRAKLTKGDAERMPICFPSLEEQKRIAAILDKADSLRRKRAQAIALADDFLRATFLDMFGDPVTNPKGWDTVKLEELILSGPTNGLYKPSSDYVDADGELGVPILRIDGFYNGRIAKGYKFKRVLIDDQTKLKFLLRDKSIVINRVNSKEYVGKAMLVSGLQEATVFESNMMNFSVSLSSVNPRFLVDQLADEFVRRQVAVMRKDAVNQSSINQNDVKSIEIRLPKLGLQEKYTEVAEVIDLLVKKYNETSDDLGCFSDSLRARLLA